MARDGGRRWRAQWHALRHGPEREPLEPCRRAPALFRGIAWWCWSVGLFLLAPVGALVAAGGPARLTHGLLIGFVACVFAGETAAFAAVVLRPTPLLLLPHDEEPV